MGLSFIMWLPIAYDALMCGVEDGDTQQAAAATRVFVRRSMARGAIKQKRKMCRMCRTPYDCFG